VLKEAAGTFTGLADAERVNMSLSQEPHHSLKRDHDSFDFDSLVDLEKPFTVPSNLSQTYAPPAQDPDLDSGESSIPTPPVSVGTNKMDPSPARSRSASLTDAGSRTPSLRGDSPVLGANLMASAQRASPSPSAFAALNGTAPPPAKKPKFSFAEREAEKEIKRIAKEIKDREIAVEKARREQVRQAQADDKARRDAEKEAERRKKEAEREQKRAALEAEKAAKEEKRRRKEEEKLEKQRAEEEKRKKDGKQKTLSSFFPTTAAAKSNFLVERRSESPAPSNTSLLAAAAASPAALTPSKPRKTAYEIAFGDFFIKEHVTLAPVNRFERDDQASESLHCTIDSYIVGDRSPDCQRHFDAIDLFHLSGQNYVPRGKRCMPVREIMAEMSGKSTRPIDLTTDSQNTQIKRTNDLLRKIPLKFLKFQEDVRPPYRGTFTSRPVNGIAKLARNPLRRDLPDTNYDYDSEAEWVEDEDAEDLNSEGDEDEDMGEDGEDMEGFLDDENDETANSKRLVLQGDLEPVSTGLCWEDHHKRSTNVKMMPYRMEVIIGKSIKPLSLF
jgi:chromatin assembly factor 1 subunit A